VTHEPSPIATPAADNSTTRERRPPIAGVVGAIIPLGIGLAFRLMFLGSVPGINGDEGWWGTQALAWRAGPLPFERTPSANPVSMLFLVPLGLVHGLGPPSFALLRSISVVANLLALGVNFWCAHRLFGLTTATIQTVALAIAPTAIAHGRFAQEPTLSILTTSLVIYAALAGVTAQRAVFGLGLGALSGMLLLAALTVHPTNIFCVPFVALPFARGLARVLRMRCDSRRRVLLGGVAFVVSSVAIAAGAWTWLLLRGISAQHGTLSHQIDGVTARLTDVAVMVEFLRNFGRLFTGVTIFYYMSGPRLSEWIYDGAALAAGVLLVAASVQRLRQPRPGALDVGLVGAWAAMLLLYYALAGPDAIRPAYERYGLCLVVPTLLIASRAIDLRLTTAPRYRATISLLAGAAGAALLLGFYVNYFVEFRTSGGRSEQTFVTAAVEPKQAAFETAMRQRHGDRPTWIVSQQWWNHWPIRYLSTVDRSVFLSFHLREDRFPRVEEAIRSGNLFIIEFVESAEFRTTQAWAAERGLSLVTTMTADASGRDFIAVMRATGPAPASR
jgi:hypothetical protein